MFKSLYFLTLINVFTACFGLVATNLDPVKMAQVKAKWVARLEAEERNLCLNRGVAIEMIHAIRQLEFKNVGEVGKYVFDLILQKDQLLNSEQRQALLSELKAEEHCVDRINCAIKFFNQVGIVTIDLEIALYIYVFWKEKSLDSASLKLTDQEIIQVRPFLIKILPEVTLEKLQLAKAATLVEKLEEGQICSGTSSSEALNHPWIKIQSDLLVQGGYSLEHVLLHEAIHIKNRDTHNIMLFAEDMYYRPFCEKRADFIAVLEHSDPVWSVKNLSHPQEPPYAHCGSLEWQELKNDILQCVVAN